MISGAPRGRGTGAGPERRRSSDWLRGAAKAVHAIEPSPRATEGQPRSTCGAILVDTGVGTSDRAFEALMDAIKPVAADPRPSVSDALALLARP